MMCNLLKHALMVYCYWLQDSLCLLEIEFIEGKIALSKIAPQENENSQEPTVLLFKSKKHWTVLTCDSRV